MKRLKRCIRLVVVGLGLTGSMIWTCGDVALSAQAPVSNLYAGSPYLGELRNTVVYGEIWERPELSKRDRSLITIAV